MPRLSDKKIKIGFIGAGTVGTALAAGLSASGYNVAAVSDCNPAAVSRFTSLIKNSLGFSGNQELAGYVDFVFITTTDDMIPRVAAQVSWHSGQSVVHCSGADSTDILEPARKAGAVVGCFHPLQTFAGIQKAIDNIPGSTFTLEAEEPLLSILKEMASGLKGNWVVLKSGDKAAYHAAAVIASNYLVTLVKMSTDLWQTFGIPQKQAVNALMPLLKGTLNNISEIGIPDCLTGPIARGDTGTVQKHLKTLENLTPDIASAYRELGLRTVPVALAKGRINEAKTLELNNILKTPVKAW